MLVRYTKIYPVSKDSFLEYLVVAGVKPEKYINLPGGRDQDKNSDYWMYDGVDGYAGTLNLLPFEGDRVHTLTIDFRKLKSYKKIDALIKAFGFEENEDDC